jgi:hypothetical protein
MRNRDGRLGEKNTDIYVRILICKNCTLEKLQAEGY